MRPILLAGTARVGPAHRADPGAGVTAYRGEMTQTRTERDTMGAVEVPADRYWGAQTQRTLQHFDIGRERSCGAARWCAGSGSSRRPRRSRTPTSGCSTPRSRGPIVRAADEVAEESSTTTSRSSSSRPAPARRPT